MNILNLALQIGISKRLLRTGWIEHKVPNPESVADHAFRVIVLTMALAPFLEVDQNKLIKMAIIHDLGEIATGDLVTERGNVINLKKRELKQKIEKKAINEILWQYGEDYVTIFQEMVDLKSKESIIFRAVDKLEMAIQAYEYQKQYGIDLSEFIKNAEKYIKHPILIKTFEDLKKKLKKNYTV